MLERLLPPPPPQLLLLLLPPLLCAGTPAEDAGFQLTLQEFVMVQEGLCAFVPCSFSYYWPYGTFSPPFHGYWFREGADVKTDSPVATNNQDREVQEETRGRFHLLWDSRNNSCSLYITDARRTDDGLYFFHMERGRAVLYSYTWKKLTVRVTALAHIPDILIPTALESGRSTNLTCCVPWACEGGTPPLFSWVSAAPASLGPRTHLSSVLTLTPRSQDHGTILTCQVQFSAVGVTVERTIQLKVTWDPEVKTGVVLGAVGGAGVTALLVVCLYAIYFIVKFRKRKEARIRMAAIMNNTRNVMVPNPAGHP